MAIATLIMGSSSVHDRSCSVSEREVVCEYVMAEILGAAGLNLANTGRLSGGMLLDLLHFSRGRCMF